MKLGLQDVQVGRTIKASVLRKAGYTLGGAAETGNATWTVQEVTGPNRFFIRNRSGEKEVVQVKVKLSTGKGKGRKTRCLYLNLN